MTRLHKLTLALTALASIGAAAPVLAQDAAFEPTSRIVRYDDLDLTNERGRERLERRIRHAANSACGFWNAKALSDRRVADECRDTAVAKAQPKVTAAIRNAAARYARAD